MTLVKMGFPWKDKMRRHIDFLHEQRVYTTIHCEFFSKTRIWDDRFRNNFYDCATQSDFLAAHHEPK